VVNRISKPKKLLKLHYKICDGSATRFDLRAIVYMHNNEGFSTCWDSKCVYFNLTNGKINSSECELLKQRAFEKLCDAEHGRCTFPVLVQLFDFYMNKFERSGTMFVIRHYRRVVVPEGVPNYGAVLGRCNSTNWAYGNLPKNWYYFLCNCSYNEVCSATRRTTRCGCCQHFRPQRHYCVAQNKDVKAWDKICTDEYEAISLEASLITFVTTSTVQDKIIQRIRILFVRQTRENPGKQKHQIQLTIANNLLTGDYQREKIAEYYNVSAKTIDRRKEEVVKLLKKYAKKDSELLDLWDNFVHLDK